MVRRTVGVKMALPSVLLLAAVALSALSMEANAATTPLAKQKRRLRKHHEVFQLPKSKGSRRKGSHKNSYEKPVENPPYLDGFYQYEEETEYPNPVDDDVTDLPLLTDEEPIIQYYGGDPTEEPTDEYYEELTLPPIQLETGYSKSSKRDTSSRSSSKSSYYKGSSSKSSKRSKHAKGLFAKQSSGAKSTQQKLKGHHDEDSSSNYDMPTAKKGGGTQKQKGHYEEESSSDYDMAAAKKGGVTKSARKEHFSNHIMTTAELKSKSKGSKSKKSHKSGDDCTSTKNGGEHLRMGKKKSPYHGSYEPHYVDGDGCKSSKSKGRGRSSSKRNSMSKGKGKSSVLRAPTVPAAPYPSPAPGNETTVAPVPFGNMTFVPSSGGGSMTGRPSPAPVVTSTPTLKEDDDETPTPETEVPTVRMGTTAPTSVVEIEMVPFALLYTISMAEIPPTEDYDAASAVTIKFIDDYLMSAYTKEDESIYLSEAVVPGNTAYSLLSGAIRDYAGMTFFSNGGDIPLPADVDATLDIAFTEDLDTLLEMLATELPAENLFSTSSNVRKVASTTSRMSAKMTSTRGYTGSRFTFKNGLVTVAAVGMLGILAYGGGRFFMGYRAQQRRLKGGFFSGDDILALGDNYFGGAYMTES